MPTPVTQDQRVLAKRTSNALDRLDAIEKTIAQLIPAINNSLGNLNQGISSQGEVLEAAVALLGRESVENSIKEARERRATETSEAQKKALEELVSRGELVAGTKVTEESVVVGREFNPDGSVRHPGRVQLAFQQVDAGFQAQFLGQAPGFTLDLPNGGKFEVQEVFELPPKAPEQAATPAEPTTAEAQ